MTEQNTPDDAGRQPAAEEPTTADAPTRPAATPVGGDSPTEAWPSLSPSSETGPSAASWGPPGVLATPSSEGEPVVAPGAAPADPAATAESLPTPPWEPTDRLPDTRLGPVDEVVSPGAAGTDAARPSRSRPGLRWALAIAGVLIVIAASALIVSLVGGRPTAAAALGYMPTTIAQYTEVRLDLPGDQRQKLAALLANFPGFKDQTQVEPKIEDVLDRIVRAATDGKQTWTADIAPWFGGQIGVGIGVPDMSGLGAGAAPGAMNGGAPTLIVLGVTDPAKAAAWLTSTGGPGIVKDSYNGTDLYRVANPGATTAVVAITDKVLLAGSIDAVKAAIDSKGQGKLADDPDVKAAFAQVDQDYVVFSVIKTRAYVDAVLKSVAKAQPGVLEGTQIDDTVQSLLPAWQASTARFESDALVMTSVSPSWAIGFDGANRKSALTGHVPATTLAYAEWHDIGPVLSAVLGKFRALPEAKAAFAAFDQAMAVLGGFDAVMGWWGDAAFAVAPGPGGAIGAGLLIQPRDKAAADRFFTTLKGFVALGGGSAGLNVRDEDHSGTTISIIDFSAVPGMAQGGLPAGYKAEFAWAVTNDVAVLGYGRDFVAAVLDAGPTTSLAGDDRFKKLIGRVGEENLGLTFVDLNGIRALVEPLIQQAAPAASWTNYQTNIKPYLEHIDAMISAVRKDGTLDRGQAALTAR